MLSIFNHIPLINNFYSGYGTILMLHRVGNLNPSRLFSNENMKVSPAFLEETILKLKSENFDFISIDQLYHILINDINVSKKIVFTLDDGYKDNYTQACQIFNKHHIPFTIYLTTSFPDKTARLWWYALEEIIINNAEITCADGNILRCTTKAEKENAFLKIRHTILTKGKEYCYPFMQNLLNKYDVNYLDINNELCLDWAEVIQLSQNPLCTLAGHTKNHYVLRLLSDKEIISEVNEANEILSVRTGKKIEHFAYPFGACGEVGSREVSILKEIGMKTCTTTRRGNIFKEHAAHLHSLPRVMLTEQFKIEQLSSIRKKRVVLL